MPFDSSVLQFGSLSFVSPLPLEAYRVGATLPEAEKKMVRHIHDLWKLTFIDNLIFPALSEVGYCFTALDRKHYAAQHNAWIEEEQYLLGKQLHHQPTMTEFLDDFSQKHVPQRFRAYYILQFPDKMPLVSAPSARQSQLAHDFLSFAELISGECYLSHYHQVQLRPAFSDFPEDFSI